jgi:hypothetical protein
MERKEGADHLPRLLLHLTTIRHDDAHLQDVHVSGLMTELPRDTRRWRRHTSSPRNRNCQLYSDGTAEQTINRRGTNDKLAITHDNSTSPHLIT